MDPEVVFEGDGERFEEGLGKRDVILRRSRAGLEDEHEHRGVTLCAVQGTDDHVRAIGGVDRAERWGLGAAWAHSCGLSSAAPREEFLGF